MFTETTEYDYEILLKRLREESFLNAGVRITLTDERPESIEKNDGVPPQESMCYEGGVRSFVQYLHEKRDLTPLHPQVIYMKGEANGAVAEVALQYCDSYNELILSFANNVHTPEGGTHEEGLKTALTRVFNEFGRAKGYLKEKDENWQGSDVREGMIAVVSVKLQEAQFEGQTKAKLGNTYIKTLVSNIVYNKLSEFLEENPAVAKAVFEKVTQAARARAAAKRPATWCAARVRWKATVCRVNWQTATRMTPPRPKSSSSRVTLLAALPNKGVIPTSRQSCRCGARC